MGIQMSTVSRHSFDVFSAGELRHELARLPSSMAKVAKDVRLVFSQVPSALLELGMGCTLTVTEPGYTDDGDIVSGSVEGTIDAGSSEIQFSFGRGGVPTEVLEQVWNALADEAVALGIPRPDVKPAPRSATVTPIAAGKVKSQEASPAPLARPGMTLLHGPDDVHGSILRAMVGVHLADQATRDEWVRVLEGVEHLCEDVIVIAEKDAQGVVHLRFHIAGSETKTVHELRSDRMSEHQLQFWIPKARSLFGHHARSGRPNKYTRRLYELPQPGLLAA